MAMGGFADRLLVQVVEEFEPAIGKGLSGSRFGEGMIGLGDDFGANGGGGNFL